MIITILEGETKGRLVLRSFDQRFIKEYGQSKIECTNSNIFESLSYVSSWVNNTIKEECLFEIE